MLEANSIAKQDPGLLISCPVCQTPTGQELLLGVMSVVGPLQPPKPMVLKKAQCSTCGILFSPDFGRRLTAALSLKPSPLPS